MKVSRLFANRLILMFTVGAFLISGTGDYLKISNSTVFAKVKNNKAEQRKQKAEQRKQKAEQRKQKAEQRKQKAEQRKQKAEQRKKQAEQKRKANAEKRKKEQAQKATANKAAAEKRKQQVTAKREAIKRKNAAKAAANKAAAQKRQREAALKRQKAAQDAANKAAAQKRQREANQAKKNKSDQKVNRNQQKKRQQEAERTRKFKRQQEVERAKKLKRQQDAERIKKPKNQQESKRIRKIKRQQEADRIRKIKHQQEIARENKRRRQQEIERRKHRRQLEKDKRNQVITPEPHVEVTPVFPEEVVPEVEFNPTNMKVYCRVGSALCVSEFVSSNDSAFSANEWEYASITVKNTSDYAVSGGDLVFKSLPAFVEFQAESIYLSDLQPGEEQTFDIQIKVGLWVTNGVPVRIQGELSNAAEVTKFYSKVEFAVDRSSSLVLLDSQNGIYDYSQQLVNGGSEVDLNLLLKNHSDYSLNSKLDVSVLRTSDPSIRIKSNSTSGFGFNYLSTTNNPKLKLTFNVSSALTGTVQYIMLELKENGKTIHTPLFYFKVQ